MRTIRTFMAVTVISITTFIASAVLDSVEAAATPPDLGNGIKLAQGRAHAPGSKIFTSDGTNTYFTYVAADDSGKETLKVLRHSGGKIIDREVVKRAPEVLNGEVSVATSKDSSSPLTVVNVVWVQNSDQDSGSGPGLYHSWSNDANLRSWSSPARISGSATSVSLVADNNGALHLLFIGEDQKIFYSSAASYKSKFEKPLSLAGTPMDNDRGVDMCVDSANNLHAAFIAKDSTGKFSVRYTKKSAGSKEWTPPVNVVSPKAGEVGGFIAIAASSASNAFIASTVLNNETLDVVSTFDGGTNWKANTVETGKHSYHVAIAVNGSNVITAGVGFENDGSEEGRIFRSLDGVTWSKSKVLKAEGSVNIIVTPSGKTAVLAREDASGVHYLHYEK